jgi:hypothetical protein
MQSFADLLSLWPSLARISDELAVPYDTVMAWKRRNSVPFEYWVPLLASAKRNKIRGISMEILAAAAERIHAKRHKDRARRRRQKRSKSTKAVDHGSTESDAMRV